MTATKQFINWKKLQWQKTIYSLVTGKPIMLAVVDDMGFYTMRSTQRFRP